MVMAGACGNPVDGGVFIFQNIELQVGKGQSQEVQMSGLNTRSVSNGCIHYSKLSSFYQCLNGIAWFLTTPEMSMITSRGPCKVVSPAEFVQYTFFVYFHIVCLC